MEKNDPTTPNSATQSTQGILLENITTLKKIPIEGILGITLVSDAIYRVASNPMWISQNRAIKMIRTHDLPNLKPLRIVSILKHRILEEGFLSLYTGSLNFILVGMLRSGIYFPLYEIGMVKFILEN